jgi:hypothetical protein
MRIDLPEGTRLIELDLQKADVLWDKFSDIPGVFDDLNRGRKDMFIGSLFSKDSVWIETEDDSGLFYLTKVVPGLHASAHVVFWDKKLRGKEELTLDLVRFCMQNIPLRKINVFLPDFSKSLKHFLERCNFKLEGKIRRWSLSDGRFFDVFVYGITYEEAFDGTVHATGVGTDTGELICEPDATVDEQSASSADGDSELSLVADRR